MTFIQYSQKQVSKCVIGIETVGSEYFSKDANIPNNIYSV